MSLTLKIVVVFVTISYFAVCTSSQTDDGRCHHFLHCKTCPEVDGKRACTDCVNKLYGLDISYDPPRCLRCNVSEGCQICTNMSVCILCRFRSHGPDLDGKATCSPCADGCSECGTNGGGKCDRCKEEFYLTSENKCSACLDNCRVCSDTSGCSICNRGFYKSNPTTCTACIENCDLCYDTTTCDRCFEGYYLKDHSHCASCGTNCQKCSTSGKCTSCKFGKISESGSCECGENCKSCGNSGYGKCDDCQYGYKLTKERTCKKSDFDRSE